MQLAAMKTREKPAASGITVRLPSPVRQRVAKEHRSLAAYIERLVERDLRERDEAERPVRIHVAAGLPNPPAGDVTREANETAERHARRTAALNTLFGAR